MGKASTKHLEPLLVRIFLVCCKEGWSVVHCILLVWHLGTTSGCISAEAGFQCLSTVCLEASSGRKNVAGASVCVHLHMCEIHTTPTENWCYQILTGLGLVSAKLGSILPPSLWMKDSLMHLLLLGCSTQSPVVLPVQKPFSLNFFLWRLQGF